jgi:hypothetical protein
MLEVRRLPSVQAVALAMPPSASAKPDGANSQPAVSADGRFVAFVSSGLDLTTLQPALTETMKGARHAFSLAIQGAAIAGFVKGPRAT